MDIRVDESCDSVHLVNVDPLGRTSFDPSVVLDRLSRSDTRFFLFFKWVFD